MNLRRLTMRNYRRHVATDIELPAGVIAVVGRNGSGKSTILEALGFALFGTTAARTGKELLRHERAGPGDDVEVTLEVVLAGQAVRLQRALRGKNLTPHATLEVDGHVLVPGGAGSSEAASKEIGRLLGMDREAFFATVVAQQKELAGLAAKTAAERKRMLLGMLGVDAIDAAIKAARRHRQTVLTKVETLQEVLPDAKRMQADLEVAEQDLQAAAQSRQKAEKALASARSRVQQAQVDAADAEAVRDRCKDAEHAADLARREHEQGKKDLRHSQEVAGRAEAAATSLQDHPPPDLEGTEDALRAARLQHAERERLQNDHARQQDARDARTRMQAEHDALVVPEVDAAAMERLADARAQRQHSATAEAQAKDRLREVRSLDGEMPCPMCERPLGGHRDSLLTRLGHDVEEAAARRREADARLKVASKDAERAQEASKSADAAIRQRQRLDAQIEALGATADAELPPVPKATDLAALEQHARDARDAHLARQTWQREAAGLASAREQLAAAAARSEAAATSMAYAEAHLADLAKEHAAWESIRVALADAQQAESAAATAAHDAERKHDAAIVARDAVRARVEEAARQRATLKHHQEELATWTALAGARTGGLLPAFRDHIVARIGPAISAEASRLLSAFTDGRYRELRLGADYDIHVGDNGVLHPVQRFSGGESDLVHLALRLAVSRLLAERHGGTELRFLALDEVFGSLDRERLDTVLAALSRLGGLYSQVVLITHQDEVRDALDVVLTVHEEDGAALVALHQG